MHRLLARQLSKAEKACGEVDLRAMLELVFTAYEQSDSDCRRTDRWISFMIGELDQLNRGLDFKSVNDTLGHQLGRELARVKTRRTLEFALRCALANGEFELYYQPLVDLQKDEVTSCEALLRWHHPERGMIAPAEFIPLAEEIGLIVPLGEWVLRKACADAALWPEEVKVAVNLSPIQVMSKNLTPVVIGALASSGLSAHRLEIEITESVFLQDTEMTLAALRQLRELGIRISMDDFGTGYSSLSYLRNFPFDKIKIDRCFISGLSDSENSRAIVQATAGLARNLGIMTTAEGVETQQQLQHVKFLDCTEMQGYLFCPPRRVEEIARLLRPRTAKKVLMASSGTPANLSSIWRGENTHRMSEGTLRKLDNQILDRGEAH